MSDAPVVHIGENSPEWVAYRLFQDIVHVEDKLLNTSEKNQQKVAKRDWILQTYAECLECVRNPAAFSRRP
jgi:hypothetical protein